ncbi:hypothetical protein J0910_09915 [Nocardiopsis sp. CNT-189]|uniref:hypothetical protein n=1 Tax=Nocardiopsis oceanisediminis TaxID=2816862 RepID=UPI003B2F642B
MNGDDGEDVAVENIVTGDVTGQIIQIGSADGGKPGGSVRNIVIGNVGGGIVVQTGSAAEADRDR